VRRGRVRRYRTGDDTTLRTLHDLEGALRKRGYANAPMLDANRFYEMHRWTTADADAFVAMLLVPLIVLGVVATRFVLALWRAPARVLLVR